MAEVDLLRILNRINGEYRRRHFAVLERSGYQGIFWGSGRLLHELEMVDGLPQKELARRLEIRPQSLTEALSKMEQAGYIVRERSEHDKREQFVRLTELGRQHSCQMREMRRQVGMEMFSCLTDDEKETIRGLLTKVLENKNTEE